ncbi:MAG: hypothetical protein ACYDHZ_00660 [Dehalococcoidia bacterium]
MSTTVQFESPPGTYVATRSFQQGQSIRIGGKVVGIAGLGESFSAVSLDISGDPITEFSPIYDNTYADALGDYWFDIVLPSVDARATVTIVAEPTIGGTDVITVPIAIGNATPAPLPEPAASTDVVKWALIGLFTLGAVYVVLQSAPKIAEARRMTPGGTR